MWPMVSQRLQYFLSLPLRSYQLSPSAVPGCGTGGVGSASSAATSFWVFSMIHTSRCRPTQARERLPTIELVPKLFDLAGHLLTQWLTEFLERSKGLFNPASVSVENRIEIRSLVLIIRSSGPPYVPLHITHRLKSGKPDLWKTMNKLVPQIF